MKKVFFTLFVCLVLMMTGCQANEPIGESNIKCFLLALYQVENNSEYEEFTQNLKINLQEASNVDKSEIDMEEIYKSYISKYKTFCTESALEELKSSGFIIKYAQQAYEEDCLFLVKDITLKKDKQNDKQFYFIVKVDKKMKDGTLILETGEGIVLINNEGYVDKFKITKQLK
ncbi:MAG: hypothetical protein AB7E31_16370 [Desulfitobacterium sp.]